MNGSNSKDETGLSFAAVDHSERQRLSGSTDGHETTALFAIPPADRNAAPETIDTSGRIGLALSGGGIRSATFSLGVLQALAFRHRLASFDYLSTV